MRLHRELYQERERPFAWRLLGSVAFWQGASFFMLVSFIWVNEVVDLAHFFYRRPPTPVDWFGASILSAGVVLIGFVSVAHTYVRQSRALDVYLVICAHCRKVRVGASAWTDLEHFLEGRTKAEFSHGICPACYAEALEAEELAPPPRAAPPPPANPSSGTGNDHTSHSPALLP